MKGKGLKHKGLLLISLIMITIGSLYGVHTQRNTNAQASDADVLDDLYSELFTNEGRYEINYDIDEEKVKEAQDLFALVDSEAVDETGEWTQVLLDVQFANQEKAKQQVAALLEETDEAAIEEHFEGVYASLDTSFNEAFKKELLAEVNDVYGEVMGVNPTAGFIGIEGIFKPYLSMGDKVNTQEVQQHIDNGHIASSLTAFNGDDDKTTYFGGHNPGIFEYMYEYMEKDAIVTVTDSNGDTHAYVMVDSVNTDTTGEPIMAYTGQTALDMYVNGTGDESIIIQFCNPDPTVMHFWYGIKQ